MDVRRGEGRKTLEWMREGEKGVERMQREEESRIDERRGEVRKRVEWMREGEKGGRD